MKHLFTHAACWATALGLAGTAFAQPGLTPAQRSIDATIVATDADGDRVRDEVSVNDLADKGTALHRASRNYLAMWSDVLVQTAAGEQFRSSQHQRVLYASNCLDHFVGKSGAKVDPVEFRGSLEGKLFNTASRRELVQRYMRAVQDYERLFAAIDVESDDYRVACNFGPGGALGKTSREIRAALVGFDENENGVADMVELVVARNIPPHTSFNRAMLGYARQAARSVADYRSRALSPTLTFQMYDEAYACLLGRVPPGKDETAKLAPIHGLENLMLTPDPSRAAAWNEFIDAYNAAQERLPRRTTDHDQACRLADIDP